MGGGGNATAVGPSLAAWQNGQSLREFARKAGRRILCADITYRVHAYDGRLEEAWHFYAIRLPTQSRFDALGALEYKDWEAQNLC